MELDDLTITDSSVEQLFDLGDSRANDPYPHIAQTLYGCWAIMPEVLQQIEDIYRARLNGEPFDREAVEDALGRPLDNRDRPYDVRFGTAVIPVTGVIAKRMNLFTAISGGASTQLIGAKLDAALDDPAVQSIVLDIDSPGGSVDGVSELAANVLGARELKPIYAVADGVMASAAYWIGSAASEVYARNSTTTLGSIGVVALHRDVSKAEEKRGIKTTEIVAGRFKRIAGQFAPLTDAGRDYLQEQVDYLYSVFVDAIATQRGVSVDTVLEEMADGRLFIGEQAIQAGLADGFMTVEQLIEKQRAARSITRRRPAAALANHQPGAPTMTDDAHSQMSAGGDDLDVTLEKHPLTKEAIEIDYPQLAEAFRADGAAKERLRIKAVEEQLMPGHEALIDDLKYDGTTSGPLAALKVLQAEKAVRSEKTKQLADDAPDALFGGPNTEAGGEGEDSAAAAVPPKEIAKRARAIVEAEEREGRKLSYSEAVQQVVNELAEENDG